MKLFTDIITVLLAVVYVHAADISNIATQLQLISAQVFPPLETLARDVYSHPEISRAEFRTHDVVVSAFQSSSWTVTPHSFGEPTAFRLEFKNSPGGFTGDLPKIGYMAEYDALLGEGHACGHHHILLNALSSAAMLRQAVINLKIPAHIVIQGTPDEENTGGKNRLEQKGAFADVDVWFAAHPSPFSIVSPMQARINGLVRLKANTHEEAVEKAYKELVIITDLGKNGLPGTASTDNPVEDVGLFSSNIVQTDISLGVSNVPLTTVQQTVESLKAADVGYAAVNFTTKQIESGVEIDYHGPGGHAAETSKGPLRLSIETFRALTNPTGDARFFLPSNTTHTELDITISCRTRYTLDLPILQQFVGAAVQPLASAPIEWDIAYPALEVTPYMPSLLIDIMSRPEYNETWQISTVAPAASDASFLQKPVVDNSTKMLTGASKAVMFPSFNICPPGTTCHFPHEPAFLEDAGSDYAYIATERIARAIAHVAIELLNDNTKMAQATSIINQE